MCGHDRQSLASAPCAKAFCRDTKREAATFRDTVVFSILRSEWPGGKAALQARLGG